MHNPTCRAAILLSAYGPSPFFAEQVESISDQMDDGDTLIIVDDGSRTVNWGSIKALPKNYIFWTRIDRLGASKSFISLIVEADVQAQYYFLADQDDLWLSNKLNVQVEYHEGIDRIASATIHGWYLVPPNGECTSDSKTIYPLQRLSHAHYCFETPAPGMTLSFTCSCRTQLIENQALLRTYCETMPHDRILIAFLSIFARLDLIPKPLVAYRQHAGNLVGAESSSWYANWLKRLRFPMRTMRSAAQGRTFYLALIRATNKEHVKVQSSQMVRKMRLRSKSVDNWLVRWVIRLLDKLNTI